MKYLAIFILIFIGCSESFPGEKQLAKVTNIAIKRLKYEYNLILSGTGVSWPNKCNAVAYDFNYEKAATISEGRRIIVNAVEIIIDSAHEVKEFEEYLAQPPFTYKHIMMGISFPPSVFMDQKDPYIELIAIMRGTIRYKIWNEAAYEYELLHEETYEEALRILDDENVICIHNDDQS